MLGGFALLRSPKRLATWPGEQRERYRPALGGASRILALCGQDGTEAFTNQHEENRRPESILASLKIGTLVQ